MSTMWLEDERGRVISYVRPVQSGYVDFAMLSHMTLLQSFSVVFSAGGRSKQSGKARRHVYTGYFMSVHLV